MSSNPEMTQTTEPSSFRLIATLGLAGFFSGLILVGGYIYTQPIIIANKAKALSVAIYQVLPGCVEYKPLVLSEGALAPAPEGTVARIFSGYNAEGVLVGYAVTVEEPGFQDIIGGIFGYDPVKKEIIGLEILDSKETPGLGDKIFKDAAFTAHFKSLATQPAIVSVKKGERENPNEVEAITGATISSKAVVRMLNKGMDEWGEVMNQ